MREKIGISFLMLSLVACSTMQPVPLSPTAQETFTSSVTPTFTASTSTPFFTPTITQTKTPILFGVCSPEQLDLVPNFNAILEDFDTRDLITPVLDFLNQGGSKQALIKSFKQYNRYIFEGDLTGDGIPEMAVRDLHLSVFGCANGKYQVWLVKDAIWTFSDTEIFSFTDMNLDGIPDIVIYSPSACGNIRRCSEVSIYEWNGKGFKSIIQNNFADEVQIAGGSTIVVKDIDGNGTQELITSGGIPNYPDYVTGWPWRVQTDTYMWNGSIFALYRTEYTPPKYRFQAIQDGDRATLQGDYDKAIVFYQQAIFSKTLEWWTPKRLAYEQAADDINFGPTTPTPIPPPIVDLAEYSHLAAYARYRIMLLYVQRGLQTEAQTTYNGLQMSSPVGHTDHAYAEMATAFWMQYQTTSDMKQACAKAIEYAAKHEREILLYLGNTADVRYHGFQSLDYQAKDVCPFGD